MFRIQEELRKPGIKRVILDTDTYNEIDDQFALSLAMLAQDKLDLVAVTAAPFHNDKSDSYADGMERSYQEILKLLKFSGLECPTYRGSDRYLPDEKTPVVSDAAQHLAELATHYTPEKPLYVVAIGAITNVASALLMNPEMKEKVVIVWLGGHAHHWNRNGEFNLMQDVAAARIIFGCGVPFVQLPCCGVVDRFTVSKPELLYWLKDKNPLANYLAENTIAAADSPTMDRPWTRVIWDVTAVGWLLNDNQRFMNDELRHSPIPEYDDRYAFDNTRHFMKYVTNINRDELFRDLFTKLVK